MRGWQCYLCKGWKEPKELTYKDKKGKLCANCKNAQQIREKAQEEAREKQKDKNDDDWDLGERQCNIDDDDCDSCQ